MVRDRNGSARTSSPLPHQPAIASTLQRFNISPPGTAPVPVTSRRLGNTTKTLTQLIRSDKAILLENALIDTSMGNLQSRLVVIPESLRAQGDPGSYIVHPAHRWTMRFAPCCSERHDHHFLHSEQRLSLPCFGGGGGELQADPQTQAVLPYEPYTSSNLPCSNWPSTRVLPQNRREGNRLREPNRWLSTLLLLSRRPRNHT